MNTKTIALRNELLEELRKNTDTNLIQICVLYRKYLIAHNQNTILIGGGMCNKIKKFIESLCVIKLYHNPDNFENPYNSNNIITAKKEIDKYLNNKLFVKMFNNLSKEHKYFIFKNIINRENDIELNFNVFSLFAKYKLLFDDKFIRHFIEKYLHDGKQDLLDKYKILFILTIDGVRTSHEITYFDFDVFVKEHFQRDKYVSMAFRDALPNGTQSIEFEYDKHKFIFREKRQILFYGIKKILFDDIDLFISDTFNTLSIKLPICFFPLNSKFVLNYLIYTQEQQNIIQTKIIKQVQTNLGLSITLGFKIRNENLQPQHNGMYIYIIEFIEALATTDNEILKPKLDRLYTVDKLIELYMSSDFDNFVVNNIRPVCVLYPKYNTKFRSVADVASYNSINEPYMSKIQEIQKAKNINKN